MIINFFILQFIIFIIHKINKYGNDKIDKTLTLYELIKLESNYTSIKKSTKNCSHYYYKFKEIDPTESKDGSSHYLCSFCGKENIEIIPKLDSLNYYNENLTYNCQHGNGLRYISKNNNNTIYEITDNNRIKHTIYGSKCSVCNQNVGEFNFKKLTNDVCNGYPRLYQLSDYWDNILLLGDDNGTILCRRSQDEGKTWSPPVEVSNLPEHMCSNVDFFELPNHEILCTYRAIGKRSFNHKNIYNRKILSSISKDGGLTWEYVGIVVDNFELALQLGKTINDAVRAVINERNVGFFEPFVSYINNTITVIYADDFTPMLLLLQKSVYKSRKLQTIYAHEFDFENKVWRKERRIIMNGYISKSPTGSGLIPKVSRDGMPVIDTMKDGTYVMVFEGSYRNRDYKIFTQSELDEYHQFVIVISYSKNGFDWSNPVEIYHERNKDSKYSAPYICITKNDQLIISFQTDEDSIYSGFKGDLYSIMKVLISKPGIPIEKINKDSFYAITNNNRSPIGGASLWSGMLLIGNKILTCSSGHPILYSEIPIYADPKDYNDLLKEKYFVINGNAIFNGNKITISRSNTLIAGRNIIISDKEFNLYTFITPNIIGDCGILFSLDKDNNLNSDINDYDYYRLIIKNNGTLILERKYRYDIMLLEKSDIILSNYNKGNEYKIMMRFLSESKEILIFINDKLAFNIKDYFEINLKHWFISDGSGAIFTQLLPE